MALRRQKLCLGGFMDLVLKAVFIGCLTVTSYRSVPGQTDDTPFYTSINEHVRAGGCAISRDLLCGACRRLHRRCDRPDNPTKLHYGDWLYIERYKFRQVNDVMGAREHYWVKTKHGRKRMFVTIRRHIDIWVGKWNEEHSVNVQHLKVYKVKEALQ